MNSTLQIALEQVFMAFKFLLRPGLSLTNGSTPEATRGGFTALRDGSPDDRTDRSPSLPKNGDR